MSADESVSADESMSDDESMSADESDAPQINNLTAPGMTDNIGGKNGQNGTNTKSKKFSNKISPVPQPSSRPGSGLSRYSELSEQNSINKVGDLFIKSKKKQFLDVAKLVLVSSPSLIIGTVLIALNLAKVFRDRAQGLGLVRTMEHSVGYNFLISAIQKERGYTCLLQNTLQYNGKHSTVKKSLMKARKETTDALSKITLWFPSPSFPNETIFRYQMGLLRSYEDDEMDAAIRKNSSGSLHMCTVTIKNYTRITDDFIGEYMKAFSRTEEGQFWLAVEAYHTFLMAEDLVGVRRALGGAYYANGKYDTKTFTQFLELTGANKRLMFVTGAVLPEAGKLLEELSARNATLINALKDLEEGILNERRAGDGSPEMGLEWFAMMSSYMELLKTVELYISEVLLKSLAKTLAALNEEYMTSIIAAVLVGVIVPPLTIWYFLSNRTIMKKIEEFTLKLKTQTEELNVEKQKTELLLNQLLPPSVAKALKAGQDVEPEHYDSVTIYFSDVVGFTSLASSATPIQVIALLNALYGLWDNILDQYDCYKVETIGDAYMVVSGLPKRNGGRHSNEIVTIALNILMSMEDFVIPHLPNERLLIRIGLHTGACAAGVVGNKMPRYCLFGDTVNTAARMESSGAGMRIQISPETYRHLNQYSPGQFTMQDRGSLQLKGKGEMEAYWVLEKKGFPYKINLEEAQKKVDNTTYWRQNYNYSKGGS